MSDKLHIQEIDSKLSLVVRKPQEGKTAVCIANITNDKRNSIHIVLTMNTLSAGMQFFGRMQEKVGPKRIVVFNSNRKTAGECHYAKTASDVMTLIQKEPIKVIVCCSHEKRIRTALPDIFRLAEDSIRLRQSNTKFVIHIDEAHKYIPENVNYIREFNDCYMVSDIIGYSATPDGIWSSKQNDKLFHKILIRDIEAELNIIRTPNYFGVIRCEFETYDEFTRNELVSEYCGDMADTESIEVSLCSNGSNVTKSLYGEKTYFDLGDEVLLLSFYDKILPLLKIDPNKFSYHFMPAYSRKVTHYQCMELILKHYPTSNVIILNGDGYNMYRLRETTGKSHIVNWYDIIKQEAEDIVDLEARKKEMDALLEPSYVIEKLIHKTRNFPTFITGFTCVGMSVTLISPTIGNFDNVVMAHHHYSRDKLYQLCRFVFNYARWPEDAVARIKTTRFHSLRKSVVDTCLEYEKHVEYMSSEYAGKICSLSEIKGNVPEKPCERELRKMALENVKLINEGGKIWKKFKVYDGNDEEIWYKVNDFYRNIRRKELKGRSMPSKNANGFYECSDSDGLGVKLAIHIAGFEKEKWTNRFQLQKDCLSYARVFVGYENLEDPTEYTVFVKYAILEDNSNTHEFLEKYAE